MTKATAAAAMVCATVAVTGCSPFDASPEPRESRAPVVAVIEDEYDGYYDAIASPVSDDDAVGAMWGSFGVGRDIAPVGWSHASAAPGAYIVTVECAGSAGIDIRFEQGDHLRDTTSRLHCPGSVSFDVTTTEPGFTVGLDSAGEPGAYRISVAARVTS